MRARSAPPLLRRRRGAALLITVVAVAAAASVVLVMVTLSLSDLRSAAATEESAAARSTASEAISAIATELALEPNSYLERVNEVERARVCVAIPSAPVVQPGSVWPAECGSVWSYTDADSDAAARVEINPPAPGRRALLVTAVGRSGETLAARTVTFTQPTSASWTLLGTSPSHTVDLASVQWPRPASTSGLSAYSGGNLSVPADLTLERGLLVAEGEISSTVDTSTRVYDTGDSGVRKLVPAPVSLGQLATSADTSRTMGCRGGDSRNVSIDGVTRSSSLCLRAGALLTNTANAEVRVPADVRAYLLVTKVSGARTTVAVYTSGVVPAPATVGDLRAAANPQVAAGVHPGAVSGEPGALWRPLGEFNLPASGVITTSADTYLGACGPGFVGAGPCVTQSGSTAPGMGVSEAVTVIAGSPSAPADVYLGSPIHSQGATLGAVAFGSVQVPYWARPSGADLSLDVAAVSLANGPGTVSQFPASIANVGSNIGGTLALTGSVAADEPDLSAAHMGQFTAVSLSAAPSVGLPPQFPSTRRSWVEVSDRPAALVDVCGEPTCDGWLSGSEPGPGGGDTTPPSTPGPLAVVAADAGATVSWTPVADADTYRVFYRRVSSDSEKIIDVSADACSSSCSATLSGLTNGVRYEVAVDATDTAGNESGRSAAAQFTPDTTPGAPGSLSASITGHNQVRLTWSAPSGGAEPSGYRVFRDGLLVAQVPGVEYVDLPTPGGVSVDYKVKAFTAAGNSVGESNTVSLLLKPDRVEDLAFTGTSSSITLTWTAPSGTVTGYHVYRADTPTFPGAAGLVGTVTSPTTTFTQSSLGEGATYHYWAIAYNASGDSPRTKVQAQTVPPKPAAPSASGQTATSLRVSWPATTGASTYDVERPASPYIVHTFTSSGTFQVTSGSGTVDYLVVGGGGGGGGTIGGGGGGGGVRSGSLAVSTGSYSATVGAGGTGGTGWGSASQQGSKGGDSAFSSITSIGGGGGSGHGGDTCTSARANGGSGGGGAKQNTAACAGTGTAGQGSNGGPVVASNYNVASGGGGAGAAGAAGTGSGYGPFVGGAGGVGVVSSISGTSEVYGSGGGGGARTYLSTCGTAPGVCNGTVGLGGPGAGSGDRANTLRPAEQNGLPNLGGGGGGGGHDTVVASTIGGSGGSGVVIVRYLRGSGITATGGTITQQTATGSWTGVAETYTDDTSVTAGPTANYRVRACNTAGCSVWSNYGTATAPASAPTGFTAPATDLAVASSWSAVSGASHYQVMRNESTDTTTVTEPSYTYTALPEATRIGARVRACNALGCGPWATAAPTTTRPATPTGFGYIDVNTSQVAFLYNDMPERVGFAVKRSGTWISGETFQWNSATDSGLAQATTYTYSVKACNAAGCSPETSGSQMTTGGVWSQFSTSTNDLNNVTNSYSSSGNYTIPAGVRRVALRGLGGRGEWGASCLSGSGPGGTPGYGADMRGQFWVTPGQELQYIIGKRGNGVYGGYPNAGSSISYPCGAMYGGGGGGLSQWRWVPDTWNDMLTAGGGGGGGNNSSTSGAVTGGAGGHAGNGAGGTGGNAAIFGVGGGGGVGGPAGGGSAAGGGYVAGGSYGAGGWGGAGSTWVGGNGGSHGGSGGSGVGGAGGAGGVHNTTYGYGFGGGGGGGSSRLNSAYVDQGYGAGAAWAGEGYVCIAWHHNTGCGPDPVFSAS